MHWEILIKVKIHRARTHGSANRRSVHTDKNSYENERETKKNNEAIENILIKKMSMT